MRETKEDLKYLREQLDLEEETIIIYDSLEMDKNCKDYKHTLKEIERLQKKITKITKNKIRNDY